MEILKIDKAKKEKNNKIKKAIEVAKRKLKQLHYEKMEKKKEEKYINKSIKENLESFEKLKKKKEMEIENETQILDILKTDKEKKDASNKKKEERELAKKKEGEEMEIRKKKKQFDLERHKRIREEKAYELGITLLEEPAKPKDLLIDGTGIDEDRKRINKADIKIWRKERDRVVRQNNILISRQEKIIINNNPIKKKIDEANKMAAAYRTLDKLAIIISEKSKALG